MSGSHPYYREIPADEWHRIELWRRGLVQKDGTALLAVGTGICRLEKVRVVRDTEDK